MELDIDITVNLLCHLIAREIDIAFLMGPVANSEIEDLPLGTYSPLIWLVSPGLKLPDRVIDLDELARFPVVTFPRSSRPHMDLETLFRDAGLWPLIHNSSSIATIV